MTKIWTPPRQWDIGELIDDLKLMEISNSLEWLKSRPRAVFETRVSNVAVALTGAAVWTVIDDTRYVLNIETAEANEDLLILFSTAWSTSAALASAHFYDILIDDTNYASSGSSTPLSNGLRQRYSLVAAGSIQNTDFMSLITIPTAGAHTLKLRMAGATQTVTIYDTNNSQEFVALDI